MSMGTGAVTSVGDPVGEYRVIRVRLLRLFNEPDVERFGVELSRHLRGNQDGRYCVDFTNIEQLSTSALSKLIAFGREARTKVALITPPRIYDIFRITSMNKLFDVYRDRRGFLIAES